MSRTDRLKARRVVEMVRMGYPEESIAEFLNPDFTRRGPSVKIADLVNFRRCDIPHARCPRQTGYDPQSGPFRCGKPALYVASIPNDPYYFVAFCERHVPTRFEAERKRIVAAEWAAYDACCAL